MRNTRVLIAATVAAVLFQPPAHAAQSYDNCTGTITSLPAVISTQGTWCLKENLTTAMTSGAAITVGANNITLDCNDFKIGGLAAGIETMAYGVHANNIQNLTVRNCGIRGFRIGIHLLNGASFGGLFEDNRIDDSTETGIEIFGGGHVLRRNRIVDTGGRPGSTQNEAIVVFADQTSITDNVVSGVNVDANGHAVGMSVVGNSNDVSRNFVTGLTPGPVGEAYGFLTGGSYGSSFRDNQLLNESAVEGKAFVSTTNNICGGNRMTGFGTPTVGSCVDAGGNVGL